MYVGHGIRSFALVATRFTLRSYGRLRLVLLMSYSHCRISYVRLQPKRVPGRLVQVGGCCGDERGIRRRHEVRATVT